jgi:transmembrane sensor
MDNDHLLILIEKYLNGEASMAEKKWLENWYLSFDKAADWLEDDSTAAAEVKAELRQTIRGKIAGAAQVTAVNKQVFVMKQKRWLVWAAALLLLVGSGVLTYLLRTSTNAMETIMATRKSRIVMLPDGSVAWLQAGSNIRYAKNFNGTVREVLLEGAAQFDIAANVHPFVVRSGKLSTRVLGTVFNIRAYPGIDSISIMVLQGKVQVSKQQQVMGILGPSDMLVYKIPTDAVAQFNTGNNELENNDVQCDDQTLEEITAVLGQWYGYSFRISDTTILRERYTGSFNRNESLEELLTILCEVNNINYQIDNSNRRVTLTRK